MPAFTASAVRAANRAVNRTGALIHEQLLSELPGWRILILPALGGLLIGPIVTRFARET